MGYKTLRGLTIAAIPASPITVTTADQTLKAWNIAENKFEYLKLEGVVNVTTTGTSVAQTLDLEVLNEAATIETFNVRSTAAIGVFVVPIVVFIRKNNKGTITLRLGNAPGNDAQTAVQIKQASIVGID